MAGALKVWTGAAWEYVKGVKGDRGPAGPAGPPSVGLTTLTSDFDQTIRQVGPTGGPQLLFRRNKELYLNDRNDIDATGASDMSATIQTYLDEAAAKKIYRIYVDTGVYTLGSTINIPRAMMLEGPMRKGQSTYPSYADNKAQFTAGASGIIMIEMASTSNGMNGVTLRGIAVNLGKQAGRTGVIGVHAKTGTLQTIEHCLFQSGDATSTAVQIQDSLYFTFRDNCLTDLYGYGLDGRADTGYYGINVGSIERNIFSGQVAALWASGIFAVRDNDFEAGSGSVGPAITIGQPGIHSNVIIEGNYWEGSNYGILIYPDSDVSIRRNDMYGATSFIAGSYGIKWQSVGTGFELVDNYINRFETGVIFPATGFSAGTYGMFMATNKWGYLTTPLAIGGVKVGWRLSSETSAPALFQTPANRIVYAGALTGGTLLYNVSTNTAIDLGRANTFHIQANANLTLTYTNPPAQKLDGEQRIVLINTGTGTITLPFASWGNREGVDAFLAPGQTRTYSYLGDQGYGLINKPYETGGAAVKPPVTRTATFTVNASADVYLCDATAGAITANLPDAATWAGGPLTVKKTDASANAVTVDPFSTQTVDGATTLTLTAQWSAVTMRPSGGNWLVTAKV